MTDIKKRIVILDEFRKRGLRSTNLHKLCIDCGIEVGERTVQKYLDVDFRVCKDDRIRSVALDMIRNFDDFKTRMQEKYK